MKIIGFATYLATRLMARPSAKDGTKPYARNAGNVFFALFAAVGMVGAVGYGFNTVLRGPISAMTETTRRTVAESTIITSSRLAIVGATTQQTGSGDCDDDGLIEPMPYRSAGGSPAPIGGGYLPAGLLPSSIDPWQTEYGYCAWDHGSVRVSDANAGCGGATPRRLQGSLLMNRYAIAIISAGKDRTFQTRCNAYVNDGTELIQRTPGSDDIVLGYTYAEANNLGNGMWKPKTADPTTTLTDKNLEIDGGGSFSDAVVLQGNTTTGGGLILPKDPGDDSITGPCDAINDKQIRYNVSTAPEPPVIEICDNGGLGWTPISGGAGGGDGATTGQLVAHYKLDELGGSVAPDSAARNDGTLYNTPTWAPTDGRIAGALSFNAAQNEYIRIPRSPAIESSAVTVSLWMKRNGAQSSWSALLAKDHNNNSAPTYHSYALYFYDANDDQIVWHVGNAAGDQGVSSSAGSIPNGEWVHVIATYDPAGSAPQQRLYLNGVLAASTTNTNPIVYNQTAAGDLYLGDATPSSGVSFNGALDDVRIYNHGMGDADVAELYASVNPPSFDLQTPKKAGMVYSWGEDNRQVLGNGTEGARTIPGPVLNGDNFIMVRATNSTACGIKADRTVWCWGGDTNGRLGNGPGVTADQSQPYQVPGLTNAVKISVFLSHICALIKDGTAWCWGENVQGSLGDGTTTTRHSPVRVQFFNDLIDISAGDDNTCVVRRNGEGWCWGVGTGGQLGNGASANSQTPVRVSNVNDFVAIYRGNVAYCGVTRRGNGYCWGTEMTGSFGNGGASGVQNTPSEITGLTDIVEIDIGDENTCALRSNGQISCWGAGTAGQLGNGTNTAVQATPVTVLGISDFVEMGTTSSTGCGLRANGEFWAWGEDYLGRLGNGEADTSNKNVPTRSFGENFIALSTNCGFGIVNPDATRTNAPNSLLADKLGVSAAGTAAAGRHSCMIKPDGTIWCWGYEEYGQLGNGGATTETQQSPVPVSDPGPWSQVAAGETFTCGIKTSDRSAWCWGRDNFGQLGNGGITGDQVSPSPVTSTLPWSTIATGTTHTCGIKIDGTGWCWGADGSGQSGNGGAGASTTPVQLDGGGQWKQISPGKGTTCGIKADNSLWCWGESEYGRLGNGTITPDLQSPTRIGTKSWKFISAEGEANCGIQTDGTAWCWGSDDSTGQLGNGSVLNTDQSVPSLVLDPGPWASISAGDITTCGVKMDGSGWCWGYDNYQLGTGTTPNPAVYVHTPVPVAGSGNWAAIEGGNIHYRCGIKNDGGVWCWGNLDTTYATLGNGPSVSGSQNIPTKVIDTPAKSAFIATSGTTAAHTALAQASMAIGSTYVTDTSGTSHGLSFPGSGRSVLRQSATPAQLLLETSSRGGAAQIGFSANSNPFYMGYNADTGGLEFGAGTNPMTQVLTPAMEVAFGGFVGIGTGGAPVAKLDVRGGIRIGDAGATCNGTNAGTIKYVGGVFSYCHGGNWVEIIATPDAGYPTWDIAPYSISASTAFSCALRADATAWCWGEDTLGELGAGTSPGIQAIPLEVSGGSQWKNISGGDVNACGVKVDGTGWCWGEGASGRLGNGTYAPTNVPVEVADSHSWRIISTSRGHHTCGITTSGEAWCWGYGDHGRRGDNMTGPSSLRWPVKVHDDTSATGWSDWVSISTGLNHTCGTRTNGEAWCWGRGSDGALGNGGLTNALRPVKVHDNLTAAGWTDWKSIVAGENATCGVRRNGTAWCWGLQTNGALGNFVTTTTRQTMPVQVHSDSSAVGWTDWVQIWGGHRTFCGIRANGEAWCWGVGTNGQAGNGLTANQSRPVRVLNSSGVAGTFWNDWAVVEPGQQHTCGVRTNGTAWCWGGQTQGKLGNNVTAGNNAYPVRILDEAP